MKKGKYIGFIPQNVAPYEATKIGIYKGNKRMGGFKLQNLRLPIMGEKLYSYGLCADAHTFVNVSYVGDATANNDYTKAIRFYRDYGCAFTTVVGDFTCYGIPYEHETYGNEFENYINLRDSNRGSMPVYEIAGNHEYWWQDLGLTIPDFQEQMESYVGHPLRYTFTHGNDVYIMCGCVSPYQALNQEGLQWLYECLEENRNKRCFLNLHPFLKGAEYCGDSTEIYPFDMLSGTYGEVFKSLLSHYHNVIYIHGHSHEMFEMQDYTQTLENALPCCYDYALGCHSIHTPSLAIPIDISSGSRVVKSGKSQGYVVDVYKNHIVLRGRDFVKDEFLPIATYCLDTTLVEIPEKSYADSTGTIVT